MRQQQPTDGPPSSTESPDLPCGSAPCMWIRLAQHTEALDTELAACARRACEALANLRFESPEANEAIAGVVMALQFQDLASQRIALMTRVQRALALRCVEVRGPDGTTAALASLDRLAHLRTSCTHSAYTHHPTDGREHVYGFSADDEARPHSSATPCPLDAAATSAQDDGVELF